MEWATSMVTTSENEKMLATQLGPYTRPHNMRILARHLSPAAMENIEHLAVCNGFSGRQACSFRRGMLKCVMGMRAFMLLQGNDHSVGSAIATAFEEAVGAHIAAHTDGNTTVTTEQQRKDGYTGGPRGPTPDFTFDPPITINGVSVAWVDAKMLYASRRFVKTKFMSESRLAATARRYNAAFGPGAYVFARGFCAALRPMVPALLLDATPVDMDAVDAVRSSPT
jgi:hypothetical protein